MGGGRKDTKKQEAGGKAGWEGLDETGGIGDGTWGKREDGAALVLQRARLRPPTTTTPTKTGPQHTREQRRQSTGTATTDTLTQAP